MFELNKKDQTEASTDGQFPKNRDRRPDNAAGRSGEIAVIGRSITIDGDLRGDENLRIDGDINGTIQLPNHNLTIGKEGRISANAYAESIVVEGTVEGDLYGAECVAVTATARVEGNIVATRVTLEEGAQFKGSIDMDPESVEAALGKLRKSQTSANSATMPGATKKVSASAKDSSSGSPVGAPNLSGTDTTNAESTH